LEFQSKITQSGQIFCCSCGDDCVYQEGKLITWRCRCGNIEFKNGLLTDHSGHHLYSFIPAEYFRAKRNIIVDLDDTLAANNYPFIGRVNEDLAKFLRKMYNRGYNIILSTCRLNPTIVGGDDELRWHRFQIKKWLAENNLSFIKIDETVKPYGSLMIDDKAVSPIVVKYISRLIEDDEGE